MVLLHYKRSEHNQFVYETTVEATVKAVIADLVEMNNTRFKVDQMAVALEELARLGPLKPEDLRGLSDDVAKVSVDQGLAKAADIPKTDRYVEDSSHFRTGYVLAEEVCNMMMTTAVEAKQAISHELAKQRKVIEKATLLKQIDLIRGAVMIGYPGYHGLPEWEPVRLLLEGQEIENKSQDVELFDETASLWWAGKELAPSKFLKEYVGKNEKTKIVCKLQKSGSGAPVREPVVDEETQRKMMAFYHKKQEEMKKTEEDDEDAYMNSAWANPRGLKNQLNGGGNIKWR